MLLYESSALATFGRVIEKSNKPAMEPWQQQDAARLKLLYEEYRRNGGLKQEEFAPKYGLKSQSNMGHYLNARRPLNLRAAVGFAEGMGVPIERFSPRLAAEASKAAPLSRNTAEPAPWPFPKVEQKKVLALGPELLAQLEAGLIGVAIANGIDVLSGEFLDSQLMGEKKRHA